MTTEYEPQEDSISEIMGQLTALHFIVKRLVADQAAKNPDSIAATLIANPRAAVEALGAHPSLGEGQYRDATLAHLEIILKDAGLIRRDFL